MTTLLHLKGKTYEKLFEDPILGLPYGGPQFLDDRDLEGEKFTENTDSGPLPFVLTYLDHAKSADLGKELIGVSEYAKTDEFGEWYYIWIREGSRYTEGLRRLKQKGFIRGSTYPFQRTAEKNANDEWETWHTVELTLTPRSMNPLATDQANYEKALTLEEIMADEENKETPTEETPPVDTSLGQEMIDQLGGVEGQPVVPLTEQIAEVVAKALDAKFEAYEKSLTDKFNAKFDGFQTTVKSALTGFAGEVSKSLRGEVRQEVDKSGARREVERTIVDKSKQPPASDKQRVAAGGPNR